MRITHMVDRTALLVLFMFVPFNAGLSAQTSVLSATSLLVESLSAMAKTAPKSIAAEGIVHIDGLKTEEPTIIKLATRDWSEYSEELIIAGRSRKIVSSEGRAISGPIGEMKATTLESAATTGRLLPLFLFSSASREPGKFLLSYISTETIDGVLTHHIRIRSRMSPLSSDSLQALSDTDVWLDNSTKLPFRMLYQQTNARGSVLATRVELVFRDYRLVEGCLFPYQIDKSINSVHWGTIELKQVVINGDVTRYFSTEVQPR